MAENLKNWYSQREAFNILNIKYRQQIKRLKDKEGFLTMELCGKPFYLRRSIDSYMEELVKKTGDINIRWQFEKKKLRIPHYDIDLDEWKPPCEILDMFPYSHEALYALSEIRTNMPMFRIKRVKGLTLFRVDDIRRYLNPLTSNEGVAILES
jgi:hypothetical protein